MLTNVPGEKITARVTSIDGDVIMLNNGNIVVTALGAAIKNGRGVCSRRLADTPLPVTRPMRALTSWIAIMKGSDKNTVHSSPVPNCAPAWV